MSCLKLVEIRHGSYKYVGTRIVGVDYLFFTMEKSLRHSLHRTLGRQKLETKNQRYLISAKSDSLMQVLKSNQISIVLILRSKIEEKQVFSLVAFRMENGKRCENLYKTSTRKAWRGNLFQPVTNRIFGKPRESNSGVQMVSGEHDSTSESRIVDLLFYYSFDFLAKVIFSKN